VDPKDSLTGVVDSGHHCPEGFLEVFLITNETNLEHVTIFAFLRNLNLDFNTFEGFVKK
jgi:hypothetical protein